MPIARKLSFLFFLFCFCGKGVAAEVLSYALEDQSLLIVTNEGKVTLTAHNEHALEVFYQPQGVKQLPSFAIGDAPHKTAISLKNADTHLVFSAGHLSAVIDKSPFSLRFYQGEKLLVEEESGLFVEDALRGFRFKLTPDEKLLGGGQRVLGMNRRGHSMPLYNRAHYGYTTDSNQMYFGLPAVMSDRKYALIFDNSAKGSLDIGHTEKDILQFEAIGGRTAYLVISGNSYPDLIEHLTDVTGRQPLPPRWSLGNFASRFGYRNAEQAKETVAAFHKEDFPLDALVLDLYWFGPDLRGYMGNLDWDTKAFPDPEKMVKEFSDQGIKTVLITEPFVLTDSTNWLQADKQGALATNPSGRSKVFEFFFGETSLIDVFKPSGQRWFADAYTRLHEQGIQGWWGDLGEPEVHPSDTMHWVEGDTASADEIHNAYGHQWAKLVYDTHRKQANQTRPFILMRSGFIGSQRYGMMPWTGDVSRSWGGLKPQVELSLQMSMFGLAYTHSDLGGYAGGEAFDREMYIRWLQFGVFQPIYRPHAQEKIPSEPVFHDSMTKDILRDYVKLRYQLLPYNYTLSYQNSLTGMPLMRPMMFENEAQAALFDIDDQYFWGNAFLVKPVTDPGLTSVNVLLPDGVWFDFWDDSRYMGGAQIEIETNIWHLPVLVRAGSFVPMVNPVSSTKYYSTASMTLHYYHDESIQHAESVMYDDDGGAVDAIESGNYQRLDFVASVESGKTTFLLKQHGAYTGMPTKRQVTLVIHNWKALPNTVRVADENLKPYQNSEAFNHARLGYRLDHKNNTLSIKLLWSDDIDILIQ